VLAVESLLFVVLGSTSSEVLLNDWDLASTVAPVVLTVATVLATVVLVAGVAVVETSLLGDGGPDSWAYYSVDPFIFFRAQKKSFKLRNGSNNFLDPSLLLVLSSKKIKVLRKTDLSAVLFLRVRETLLPSSGMAEAKVLGFNSFGRAQGPQIRPQDQENSDASGQFHFS